jgi:hypothetical protein
MIDIIEPQRTCSLHLKDSRCQSRHKIFDVWKDHRISILLDFLVKLCVTDEGREGLYKFLKVCDEKLCEPSWLALFVLGPVNFIAQECISMIKKDDIFWKKQEQEKKEEIICDKGKLNDKEKERSKDPWTGYPQKKVKLLALLKQWYTIRYIEGIAEFIQHFNGEEKYTTEEYNEYLGNTEENASFVTPKELSISLLLIPNEFHRWSDQYDPEGKTRIDKYEYVPFDLNLRMDQSFLAAVDAHLRKTPNEKKMNDPIGNHSSWDPKKLLRHLANESFRTRGIYRSKKRIDQVRNSMTFVA